MISLWLVEVIPDISHHELYVVNVLLQPILDVLPAVLWSHQLWPRCNFCESLHILDQLHTPWCTSMSLQIPLDLCYEQAQLA